MGLFSKGKMEMKLEKYSFAPGESIKGSLNFSMKKPREARGVYVKLHGQEITIKRTSSGTERKYITICDIDIPLDGEREYTNGNYDFEVPIPGDALDVSRRPQGMLGDAVGALEFLSGTSRQMKWKVRAYVDMKGFDLKKDQDIVINQG